MFCGVCSKEKIKYVITRHGYFIGAAVAVIVIVTTTIGVAFYSIKVEREMLTTGSVPQKLVQQNFFGPLDSPGSAIANGEDFFNGMVNSMLEEVGKHIFPGTMWCGLGNVQQSYNDLGYHKDTDICCRAHDNCPQYLEPGDSKYGLKNPRTYTNSHCDCDKEMYECFKKANTTISNMLGFGYFTFLAPKCFKEEHPVVECERYKYTRFAMKRRDMTRCVAYKYNRNEPKKYQWFDNPIY